MPTILNRSSKYALWFASLLMLACAGGATEPLPEPVTLGTQAISRLPCLANADCSPHGGSCSAGLCHADNECATAADCSDGSECLADVHFGGLCASADSSGPIPSPAGMCASDGSCPAGQACDADGMCHAIRACHSNRDCHKGQVCDSATGRCVPRPPRACRTDSDCPPGTVCDPATALCSPRPCTPQPDGTCK